MVTITQEQNIIFNKTHLDGTTHEQTIICRQLFAGHVVGSGPTKRGDIVHRMILKLNVSSLIFIPIKTESNIIVLRSLLSREATRILIRIIICLFHLYVLHIKHVKACSCFSLSMSRTLIPRDAYVSFTRAIPSFLDETSHFLGGCETQSNEKPC